MRLYLCKPPGQPTISKVLFFLKQQSPKIIFALIGLMQQTGKSVFVKYMLSLRTSPQTGVAIPRLKGTR